MVAIRGGLRGYAIDTLVTASAAETDTNERKYQGKDKLQCSSLENMRDYFEEWKMSSKRSPILLHGFMN